MIDSANVLRSLGTSLATLLVSRTLFSHTNLWIV
jgi:hypothetical protein